MRTAPAPIPLRTVLLQRLADARARTDELFRVVHPDALTDRPIAERHRIVFYLGHLEAFDWNLLNGQVFGLPPVHAEFEKLFAFGIDPVGGGLPDDQPSDWPARAEIDRFNQRIRSAIDAHLETYSFNDGVQPLLRDGFILQVAIEHRLMHAETLAYMLHQLPLDRKLGQMQRAVHASSNSPAGGLPAVDIPAGTVTLGMPFPSDAPGAAKFAGGAFGWDNEFPQLRVEVPAFSIAAFPVTNGEFLNFIEEGGYDHRPFWNDAAWQWRENNRVRHPLFWRKNADTWFYRGMFTETPLPLDGPAYTSHAEAAAFARWAGKELPTEAEWHRAAYGTLGGAENQFPWGADPPAPHHGNFDFERWDPMPVGAFPQGRSAFGVHELIGNGWEWTSSIFGPFPGFEPFPFYPGYSANFFDGQHYVMKGGSPRTASCMLRRSFRNWFQPHYPYVYAKFRCVKR